ncbi:hypothetical protein P43SY_003120 [Pythium insidiosum]|uniref:HMA domain-containing protein n=1 Tax=Pythium insidiosum TaxID=114742 RepID=A0AAD5LRY1_PYTIN|nr:hypothetical protein P43SY_003120 [Pythium insidiosum]
MPTDSNLKKKKKRAPNGNASKSNGSFVGEQEELLLPVADGAFTDGVCVSADEDVPSLTSSQRREQDEHAVFLIIPSLDNPEVATRVTNALRDAPGVHDVQLDLLEKLARIELFSAVSESDEVELADVVRRVENLIAYPVWQHRDRVVKLTIDGMRCMTNCGTQVIRALERVPGVLHIHVDSKSKTAEVTLGKGCTATEVDLIKCIRAANPRFDAFIAKDTGAARTHSNSIPGAVLLTIDAKSYDISSIRKIEAALRDTDGVIEATVEVASRRVTVLLEPECQLTEDDLIDIVQSAGTDCHAALYEPFSDSRDVLLTVNGMSCAKNCARKVQQALSEASGVQRATVDFENRLAHVFLEPGSRLNESDLVDIIKSAGSKFSASVYQPPQEPRTITLQVEGMNCAKNCARKIQAALASTRGVLDAQVDFPTKIASVEVPANSRLTDEDLVQAVKQVAPKFSATVVRRPRVVKLEVSGMSCAKNCATKVQKALAEVDGVQSAVVDFPSKLASVEMNGKSKLTDADLIAAVRSAGSKFDASIHSEVRKTQPTAPEKNAIAGSTCPLQPSVEPQSKATPLKTAGKHADDVVININGDAKEDIGEATILVGGMTCNSCANSVEGALKLVPGVAFAVVNFATETATVRFHRDVVGVRTLIEAVETIGYDASYVSQQEAQKALDDQRSHEITRYRNDVFIAVLFTFPIMIIMMVFGNIEAIADGLMTTVFRGVTWMALVVFLLSTPVVIFCGRRFHIDAWKGFKNHVLGMSFLVSMGTNASYFYGIFTLIRSIALNDSRVSNPDMFMTAAMLVTFVVIGKFLEAVAKGKTSEALGKLLELQAKSANLLIFDRSGTKVVEEKVVAIELVQRGDILKVVRGSSIPADGIVVYGEGRVDESMLTGESKTIKKNVGDKVLGATVNVDGLFHMQVTGIGSESALNQIIRLVEDAQTSKAPIQAYADYIASIFVPTVILLSTLTFVVCEHPLGKAIIDYAKFISISLEQPTNFKGVSGRGISCEVDGKKIVIGNREWMVDNGLQRLDSITLQQATVTFQNAGKTPVYMGVGVRICAVFGVADAPRPESVRTIAKLQQMGLDVWMVTGDNRRTAISIADQLGISRRNVMAEVIPSDKASKVKQLQSSGRRVAMVGDGINDSPALAQADLGIAIGAGTEIAVETAGMVLMKSNLWDVISALDLSRTIFNRIRINYGWAMGYNCLLIPLAAGALYPFGFSIPPMFAGGAMALSSVSVVTSSLLLRYYSPPEMPDVYSANENKSVLFRKPSEATPLLASSSMD